MHAEKPPRVAYRFDRFTLDLARGALLASDGAELPLRPKSFALLQLLVENAGRLLDRDAIMRAVWPDVFVTDDSITQCVHDIRRAFGDDTQRLLRTVPRRGYLLAAEVTRAEALALLATTVPPNPAATLPPPAPDQEKAQPPAPGETTQPAAERRQLTILFCDLAGSTALSVRL